MIFKIFFKSLNFLFKIVLFFGLFLSCSSGYKMWEPVQIKDITFTYDTVASPPDGNIFMDIRGVPPFYVEVFFNPQFKGTSKGLLKIDSEGVVNLINPTPINTIVNLKSHPLYFRARSEFSNWIIYSDSSGNPQPVILIDKDSIQGTSSNPFIISTAQDLIDLLNQDPRFNSFNSSVGLMTPWKNNYLIISDIDLTGYTWKPLGNNSDPWQGGIDGNGHIIFGIEKIESYPGDPYFGFFGYSNAGYIHRLGIEIGDITAGDDDLYVGGFAGALNNGYFSNCYVSGLGIRSVLHDSSATLGGFVGLIQNTHPDSTILEDCYSNITVEGTERVGGFIGNCYSSQAIQNCYALGDVYTSGKTSIFSEARTGGFAGNILLNSSIPVNCIALNQKIVRFNGGDAQVCFYGFSERSPSSPVFHNKNISADGGTAYYYGSGPYETSEPVNPYTISKNTPPFNSWDFTDSWIWDDSINRPVLRIFKRDY